MKEDLVKRWRPIIAQWQASGLSKAEFCRRNDIDLTTFKYHSVKQHAYSSPRKKVSSKKSSSGDSFAQVVCTESTPEVPTGPNTALLVLRLDCGGSIELTAGFDAELLKRVLQVARDLL
jgi:hypothetical protein